MLKVSEAIHAERPSHKALQNAPEHKELVNICWQTYLKTLKENLSLGRSRD